VKVQNYNDINIRLGIRAKEMDFLISTAEFLTEELFGTKVTLDKDNYCVAGHSLGATTAVLLAARDPRVKRVLTFDPWLTPLADEIKQGNVKVKVPHCSVGNELFIHQKAAGNNWELLA